MKDIINVTAHDINFIDIKTGEEYVVKPSGFLARAEYIEDYVGVWLLYGEEEEDKVELVKTRYVADKETERKIISWRESLRKEGRNPIFVGSIIAAQVYKGLVVGMISAPGYERSYLDNDKIRDDKFVIF